MRLSGFKANQNDNNATCASSPYGKKLSASAASELDIYVYYPIGICDWEGYVTNVNGMKSAIIVIYRFVVKHVMIECFRHIGHGWPL